jgi:D-glycero-D-manno-heptose 1,7-bisphosphate phosphatase
MTSAISGISKQWSLFLDRDGVINERLVDNYVTRREDFAFIPGVLDAMKLFAEAFGPIVVVTNQQGVEKGLMTEGQLRVIHAEMIAQIVKAGGRIDKVYFCTGLHFNNPFCRKPNPGMALQARRDNPRINFKRSLMVGDSLSDLVFGKRLGMKTVLIAETNQLAQQHPQLTDFWFKNLTDLAGFLQSAKNKTDG